MRNRHILQEIIRNLQIRLQDVQNGGWNAACQDYKRLNDITTTLETNESSPNNSLCSANTKTFDNYNEGTSSPSVSSFNRESKACTGFGSDNRLAEEIANDSGNCGVNSEREIPDNQGNSGSFRPQIMKL